MSKKIIIYRGFFALLSVMVFFLDTSSFFAALLAVAVHEAAHLSAMSLFGLHADKIALTSGGINITYDGKYTPYFYDILIALAGPMANILCTSLSAAAYSKTGSDFAAEMTVFNTALCVFNLLPVKYFDGGRIIYSILAAIIDPITAEKIIEVFTVFFAVMIFFFGVYLFYKTKYNFTMLIAALWLFYIVKGEKLV